MTTMRQALRQAAEDHKGMAAIVGSFIAGGLCVSALSGAITQPRENAEAIMVIQGEVGEVRDQVDAVVTFVESQALFNCTLLARVLEEIPLATCRDMPGVMSPPPGAGGPP